MFIHCRYVDILFPLTKHTYHTSNILFPFQFIMFERVTKQTLPNSMNMDSP